MSLLKYIERLKRMDDLIRRKATGSAYEFAEKLGVSQSQLFQDLKEMKELGAPVNYCHISRSYLYTRDCRVFLDFKSSKVYGGMQVAEFRSSIEYFLSLTKGKI
jgi:transcriptional antiterminator